MLGRGKADKNKPGNWEVLRQMEKRFVRAFRTISELKGTSKRSKKKCSPHCMTSRGPKSGGYTVNQFCIWSRTIQKLCLHEELTLEAANNPKILYNYPKTARKRTGFSCHCTVSVSSPAFGPFALGNKHLSKHLPLCPYLLPQLFRSHRSPKKALKIQSYFWALNN